MPIHVRREIPISQREKLISQRETRFPTGNNYFPVGNDFPTGNEDVPAGNSYFPENCLQNFANLANISEFFGRSSPTNHTIQENSHSMIPSKRWFPTTLIDRSAWVSNFAKNFANVALDLGFTAADIDSMNKDAEDLRRWPARSPPPKPLCPVSAAFGPC